MKHEDIKNSKIKSGATIELKVSILLTESEVKALEVFTKWGADAFLDVFYKTLGKNDLQEHEAGVRSLFETIRQELPQHIHRIDNARKAFNGAELKDE